MKERTGTSAQLRLFRSEFKDQNCFPGRDCQILQRSMDVYSVTKYKPWPCPRFTPVSDMSSCLLEREYKWSFVLQYQPLSLLIQHNLAPFYDANFLPGVALGNICASKHGRPPTLTFVLTSREMPGTLRPLFRASIPGTLPWFIPLIYGLKQWGQAITSLISVSQRAWKCSLYGLAGSIKADIRDHR